MKVEGPSASAGGGREPAVPAGPPGQLPGPELACWLGKGC